jgi:hypothetical protein
MPSKAVVPSNEKSRRILFKATALFNIFPRSLCDDMHEEWKIIEVGIGVDEYDKEDFDKVLKEFVKTYSSDRDQRELLNQVRKPTKPRNMTVQAFYSRLVDLNNAIPWLLGKEMWMETMKSLEDEQLRGAFYEGMPAAWRERFVYAGKSVAWMETMNIVHYFREMEVMANRRQSEHESNQKKNKAKRPAEGRGKQPHKKKKGNGSKEATAKDSDPCPKHP